MNKTVETIRTHIPMDGLCNARHLGGYETTQGATKDYAFVRCEAPTLSKMTNRDIAKVLSMGIRTIIDMRNASEIWQEPSVFPFLPMVRTYHIPIFGTDEDIETFNVTERGESNCWMLDHPHCQAGYKKVFETILKAKGPVLFHCAAGKDRTGLLAAMLLLNAGVSEETVAGEYGLTQTLLKPWVDENAAETPELSKEELDKLHGAYPSYMETAIGHINTVYGNVEGYLCAIGLNPSEVDGLRQKMFRPTARFERQTA